MKKSLLVLATTLLAFSASADVFSDYQASGQKALTLALDPATNPTDVVTELTTLIQHGYQIMDLYELKFTECAEQFAQLKSVDATLSELPYEEIDRLYHAGQGLVVAPRTCYKGRSLVVHPYQIMALAKANQLQQNKDDVEHELTEVVERAGKIKETLGL